MSAHIIVSFGEHIVEEFDTDNWQRDAKFVREALKREAAALRSEPERSNEMKRLAAASYNRVVVIQDGTCVLDRPAHSHMRARKI